MVRAPAYLAVALALSSCVGPDFKIPDAPDITKFTADPVAASNPAGRKTQHLDVNLDLPTNYWALFHSQSLNNLIQRALRDNPNVDAARAALRIARANVYAEAGLLYPQASGNYTGQGGKIATGTANGGGVAAPVVGPGGNNPSYYSLHTAQFNVSFVPDVWGGTRRQIENLEALRENQLFQNEATFLTLTSNIATGAIAEASLRAQIEVTQRLIKISRTILEKIREQTNAGKLSGLDLASQEALVAQTEVTLPPLQKALAVQRDQLTVLSGHLPGEGLPERFEFKNFQLPRKLPVSLPSDLIRQRPDIRAAEANLHASQALIGVAIANRLPQFALTGNIGRSGSLFKNLFSNNPAFYFYTGLASASQTIFDGFTLQQRQRAAEAGFDQTAAQYRLAVLTGFQNVADALNAIQFDTATLRKAIEAEAATAKALRLTRLQLDQGQVAIQQVLTSQTASLQASLTVIQSQQNRFTDTVGLLQALGGGWWNRDAPPPVDPFETYVSNIAGIDPDPLATAYPGATQNNAR